MSKPAWWMPEEDYDDFADLEDDDGLDPEDEEADEDGPLWEDSESDDPEGWGFEVSRAIHAEEFHDPYLR